MRILPESINKGIGKAYSFVSSRKLIAKTLDHAAKNPDKYATAMVVTSIVSKDFINCYYYTTQSLHNDKIPEEKRKFVASLDLMNGIIMVGGQLLAGIVFEKTLNNLLFKKLIDKRLDSDVLKKHAQKLMEEAKRAGKNFKLEEVSEELINQYGSKSKKYGLMKSGFKLVIVFAATTALTKRIIAPLLSTPLAGWFKDKFMDKNKKPAEKKEPESKEVAIQVANSTFNNNATKPVFNKVAG